MLQSFRQSLLTDTTAAADAAPSTSITADSSRASGHDPDAPTIAGVQGPSTATESFIQVHDRAVFTSSADAILLDNLTCTSEANKGIFRAEEARDINARLAGVVGWRAAPVPQSKTRDPSHATFREPALSESQTLAAENQGQKQEASSPEQSDRSIPGRQSRAIDNIAPVTGRPTQIRASEHPDANEKMGR